MQFIDRTRVAARSKPDGGVDQPGAVSVINVYLPNKGIVRAADAFGNLTTFRFDVSRANLLRGDVGTLRLDT